jgi:hypothetical protein
LENQLCKVEFDLGKEETVSKVCSKHRKRAKTRDTKSKEKIDQKKSCEIAKGGERQSSVNKEGSKNGRIMSNNDESNGSDTNLKVLSRCIPKHIKKEQ